MGFIFCRIEKEIRSENDSGLFNKLPLSRIRVNPILIRVWDRLNIRPVAPLAAQAEIILNAKTSSCWLREKVAGGMSWARHKAA